MTLSEVTTQRSTRAIWIISTLTTLSSALAGPAAAAPKTLTLSPPYDETQSQQDDCGDQPGNDKSLDEGVFTHSDLIDYCGYSREEPLVEASDETMHGMCRRQGA